ncbi:hypothetical protein D3C76_758810 [compost metagenome]
MEILHRLGRQAYVLEQEILVADGFQVRGFFLGGFAGQVILGRHVQGDQRLAVGLRQREVVDEVRDGAGVQLVRGDVVGHHRRRVAGHQFVFAEVFLVEEHPARQAQARVELAIERGLEAFDVHPEFLQQAVHFLAVQMIRRLEGFTAAVADDHATTGGEFIALGVAAEVVVVFQNQDARFRMFLTVEPRSGQSAEAASYHHQVIFLGDRQFVGVEDLFLPPHLVGHFERADVVTPQTGQCWRVVAPVRGGLEKLQRGHAGSDGDSDAVEKVAAGDIHIHSLLVFQIAPAPRRHRGECRYRLTFQASPAGAVPWSYGLAIHM